MLRPFIALSLILFAGCSSLTPVLYDFAENEEDSVFISFSRGNPRVTLVYYNNEEFPKPEKGTIWDPVAFPAAIPLEIMVHARYGQQSSSYYYAYYNPYYNPYHKPHHNHNHNHHHHHKPHADFWGAFMFATMESAMEASRAVDIDVLFNCPPLEAGKKYSLSFRKEAGTPGKNKLVLVDTETRKIIYQQEFKAH
jgi:hypothetical protein